MAFSILLPETILTKRYKIVQLIRRGGMGATYRSEDLELKKSVAVKQLPEHFQSQDARETAIGNFLTEMAILKSIDHPQIPKILDQFVERNAFYFVQEFIPGSDFTAILEKSGRQGIPEEEVIRIGISVCRILHYLHNRKPEPIIHRDIKPSNLMKRSRDGEIMLLDFGISRALVPPDQMLGTLGYAPPEQFEDRTDARSDLYSLGVTLHELSTGLRPNPDRYEFRAPHETNPNLSPEFSAMILTALQLSPRNRFQSAEAFEHGLASLMSEPHPFADGGFNREILKGFQEETILPALRDLKSRHANDCQNERLPKSFHHFTFTLGAQFPHSLLIDVDHARHAISFHMKEGLLPAKLLGEISPLDPKAESSLIKILEIYEDAYLKRY